jgi:hypothetical protein
MIYSRSSFIIMGGKLIWSVPLKRSSPFCDRLKIANWNALGIALFPVKSIFVNLKCRHIYFLSTWSYYMSVFEKIAASYFRSTHCMVSELNVKKTGHINGVLGKFLKLNADRFVVFGKTSSSYFVFWQQVSRTNFIPQLMNSRVIFWATVECANFNRIFYKVN